MVYIDIYKQYITVTSLTFSKLLFTLYNFNKQLTTYKLSSVKANYRSKPVLVSKEDKFFYVIETETPENPNNKNLIRYAKESLKPLIEYLNSNGIPDSEIKLTEHEYETYGEFPISINPDYTPRPYQKKYIDKIVNWKDNNILIDLQTGMGKTFIAMSAVSEMKKRFSMVVLPRYIDKWIFDITNLTNIEKHEILILKGSKSILNMLMMPTTDILKYKAVIISLKSIAIFLKEYLTNNLPVAKGITPDNIFNHLATEVVINDESHQEFHNVFKLMLFSNVRLFIGLTATLVSNDDDMEKMYHVLFPDKNRISNIIPYKKYITIYAVRYRFQNRKNIRYKTQFGYNQATFEASLLKHSLIKKNYFNMLKLFLERAYIKRRDKNDKALIFMGTIDMCNAFINYAYMDPKFKSLKMNKYTEEDDYDTINTSDVIVSTIGSAGTALDIPNLITVLQTVNVDSPQANIQTLGRLREVDKPVLFIYFWSSDIRPHGKYHANRIKIFKPRSKSITAVDYRDML